MKALSLCIEPGCGELTTSGRCADCEDEHQRRRRAARKRTPDPKDRHWRQIRGSYLRRHPHCECEDCERLPEHRRPLASDVHHIKGRDEGGSHRDENLLAMAHGHHSKLTATQQPGGFNAYKTRPKIRR